MHEESYDYLVCADYLDLCSANLAKQVVPPSPNRRREDARIIVEQFNLRSMTAEAMRRMPHSDLGRGSTRSARLGNIGGGFGDSALTVYVRRK